ncbi:hypothetical protein [Lysinibacillus sp. NPDC092081]|uniref:hypothetical protein n=1 Tax=Lysinibacillus sp. NPDC092081 TaxID=3364131 RepID=UPI00380B6E91
MILDEGTTELTCSVGLPKNVKIDDTLIQHIVDDSIRNVSESVQFVAVENSLKALEKTDAVITITPSQKPLIFKERIKPGIHFNCVGADMTGKQEIVEKIFEVASVYVDDITQASTVGETQSAIRAGILGKNNLTEIGQFILGNAKGRTSDEEITIFDSTGIALQDLAVSKYIVSKAEKMNVGTIVQI